MEIKAAKSLWFWQPLLGGSLHTLCRAASTRAQALAGYLGVLYQRFPSWRFVFQYCTRFSARFAAHVIAMDFCGEHGFTAGECELVWIIIMIQAEI